MVTDYFYIKTMCIFFLYMLFVEGKEWGRYIRNKKHVIILRYSCVCVGVFLARTHTRERDRERAGFIPSSVAVKFTCVCVCVYEGVN